MAKNSKEMDLTWFGQKARPAEGGEPEGQKMPTAQELMGIITGLQAEVKTLKEPRAPVKRAEKQKYIPLSEEVDVKNLPDPAIDPTGYTTGYTARINKAMDNKLRNRELAAQEQNDRQAQTNNLWNEFSNANPRFKDKAELIGVLAEKAVQEAQAQGMDTDDFMYGAGKHQFFKTVVDRAEKILGPAAPEPETEDEPDDALRTAIFGGGDSGGKPMSGSKKDKEEKPESMFGPINDWQIRHGFHS